MLKEIKVLINLQELDDKILRNTKEIKRLPKVVQELEEKYSSEQESVKNITQRLEQNLMQQKKLELDITSNNQDINKYENQLLSVKTNKEYKALNAEITHRKEKNADIEEQLIEFMEEESVLREEKRNLKNFFKKIRKYLKWKNLRSTNRLPSFKKRLMSLKLKSSNCQKRSLIFSFAGIKDLSSMDKEKLLSP